MAMQSEANKRARSATVQDMAVVGAEAAAAATEGNFADKIQEMIAAKLEELGVTGVDASPNEEFRDFVIGSSEDMKELRDRCEALEARATVTEAVVFEIATDLYKNSVRVTPKPRVKGGSVLGKSAGTRQGTPEGPERADREAWLRLPGRRSQRFLFSKTEI